MGQPLDLSIIVVSWNVRDLLAQCLASVMANISLPLGRYEVIVVDNASADGSATMVAQDFPGVNLLVNTSNMEFGAACNQGYAHSQGGFVLLLNPDTLVTATAIGTLLSTMASYPFAGIVGGCLLNGDGSFQRASGGALPSLSNIVCHYLLPGRFVPDGWVAPLNFKRAGQGVVQAGWVSGGAMLLRRQALGSAAIFDESYFMYGEDWDVCDRLHRQGWQVLFCPDAKIIHHQRSSHKQQSSSQLSCAVHKGPRQYFARKHPPWHLWLYDGILLLGYSLRYTVYSLMAFIRPGRGGASSAIFCRQFLGFILHSFGKKD